MSFIFVVLKFINLSLRPPRINIPLSIQRNSSAKAAVNTSEDALIISDSCVKRLKEISENGACLRVTVEGGGCSGFQYKFDLDSNIQDDDK